MKKFYVFILFFVLAVNNYALTLDDAVKNALQNNLGLQYESKVIESKKFEYESVKANRFPTLILDGKYTILDEKKAEPFSTPFGTNDVTILEKDYYEFFAGLRFNIYTGGLISSSIKAKLHEKKIEDYKFEEEKNGLIYKAKSAYINILKLIANKKVVEEYIRSLNKHLNDVKVMYEQGVVPYIDILQTEVKVEDAKQKLIDIENKIEIAKFNLATLMGKSKSTFDVEDIDINVSLERKLDELLTLATKNRAILKTFDENIKVIDSLKSVSKSDLLPKLYVQGGYQYSNSVDEVEPKGNFMVQFGINYNLIWDKPIKEVKARDSMKYALIKYKNDMKLKIMLEVQNAYKSYETAKKNLEVAKIQEEKAAEYFRIVDLKYKEGLASNTDLLDANAMLVEAKMNVKNAYYEMIDKYFALEKSIGKELR